MAAQAIELQETRDSSESAGKVTASRKFAIWDEGGSQIATPAEVRAVFGTTAGSTAVPDIGDLFPGETDIYATSYSIQHEPASRGVWTVTFNYENTEPGPLQPQEPGYSQFSFDWSSEFRDVWRVNPGLTVPNNGNATNNSLAGGQPIDVAGEPMSVLRYFATLEITETVLLGTLDARAALIMSLRGTRNAAVFRGGAVGTVIYKGAKASRIGLDKVSITHSFAQDDWYHMIQFPQKGADGRVVLEQVQPGIMHAQTVFWRQPFPLLSDFNLLSENF
jgi:hypothetical protein